MQTFFFHGFSAGGGAPLAPFAHELGLDMQDVVLLDLPGFSANTEAIDPEVLADPGAYLDMAEPGIMRQIRGDHIRIVAYSHGAIPAFLFAARHQDIVSQLVLICPASSLHAFVSLLPRVMNGTARFVGLDHLLGIMRSRFLVDAMTLYGRKPYWTRQTLIERLRTRREESAQYNVNMFYLMRQLQVFQREYAEIRIDTVPTIILRTTDDEVIGRNSVQWFQSHIAHTKVVSMIGGHAVLAVAPRKAAQRLIKLL